ncbi:hypothetical protein ACFFV7_13515 [Nonomuraea spiralis]|uniref:Uncharacterized protein n=1 Tax=Nonomuraea spiralis TaxID=46182 RepID=A0ABV5ICG7_9ACTN|nr:hypothetical protein [Nonomuraea spiralis]GGS78170.1 hypothetical protein GCM10010176_021560 [Nonomuraea spiralis]
MTVVGRVVAAVAVVAASIVIGGSAQAAVVTRQAESAGEITSPSDGQVVTGSSVTVSARTGLMQLKMGLYVDGPSTPSLRVAGGGANETISGTFDAGSAPNGTFTVTLKGEITGSKYASTTFKLRRPPETPGNVNARLEGTGKIEVTWSKGSEPDLQSYEVSTSQSGVVGRLPADSACSGSSCKAVLAVPAKAAGRRVGIMVKAFRGDGDGGSVGSGKSGAAYVMVPAAATSQAKKQKTDTRRAPKTDGRKGVEALPTLPAKKQVRPTTVPTRKPTASHRKTSALPSLPDADTKGNLPIPTTADGTAEDDGGTGGHRASGTDKGAKGDTEAVPVRAGGVEAQSDESPMGDIGQYGIYVVIGLLLLLLAAQAGAWARRRALAAAASGSGSGGGSGGGVGSRAAAHTAAAAAATGSGGDTSVRSGAGNVPTGGTARRRPAVVLAVARTRMPEPPQDQPRTPQPTQPNAQPNAQLNAQMNGQANAQATGQPNAQMNGQATGQATGQTNGQVSGQADAQTDGQADGRGSGPVSDRVAGGMGVCGGSAVESGAEARALGAASAHVPAALPMHLDVHDLRAAQKARPEPVRITLSSSAVTDVPQPAPPAAPPATRIEDRWDDYLPPSPRSMEDSGFWERPQPGADDFWAPDDNEEDSERAFAGRHPKKGDS